MGFLFGNLIELVLLALTLLVLGRVILSWVDPGSRSPLAIFVFRTTEPVLGPVRRSAETGLGLSLACLGLI